MKFLHTSDLHIGKTVNDFSMLSDQKAILEQILSAAVQEQVDAMILAGDIYDRAIPPAEAVEVLDRFLTDLLKAGIVVLMISGNHDSPERLGFGESILEKQGLYIAGSHKGPLKYVTLPDAYGSVRFVLLPFVRPAVMGCRSTEEAVGRILEKVWQDGGRDGRNVLVTHFFVTQGEKEPELSDAETTIHVGGIDNVDASLFEAFDYTALGHIHKPQKAGNGQIWYAGAPLAYTFSECGHEKSVQIVELKEKGSVTVRRIGLKPLHAMRRMEGSLKELLEVLPDSAGREDYLQAILTNEEELIDPIGVLRSVYPNIMQIVLAKRKKERKAGASVRKAIHKKNTAELFAQFFETVRGEPMDEARKRIVENTVRGLNDR